MLVYEMVWISFGICLLAYGLYNWARKRRNKKR